MKKTITDFKELNIQSNLTHYCKDCKNKDLTIESQTLFYQNKPCEMITFVSCKNKPLCEKWHDLMKHNVGTVLNEVVKRCK